MAFDFNATPPPHCDASVLHGPGKCRYCDARSDWQELRQLWGIAFTGETPTDHQIACPSDFRRGLGGAGRQWPGNRAEVPGGA